LHGQTGAAPNGIEVHPALNITFGGTSALPPEVEGAVAGNVPAIQYPADMVLDNDGGRAGVFRGGDTVGDPLYHGGSVMERPSLQILFAGDQWSAADRESVLEIARSLSADGRFASLSRYGITTSGMMVDSRDIDSVGRELKSPVDRPLDLIPFTRGTTPSQSRAVNDLDVQRALANAVDDGRAQ